MSNVETVRNNIDKVNILIKNISAKLKKRDEQTTRFAFDLNDALCFSSPNEDEWNEDNERTWYDENGVERSNLTDVKDKYSDFISTSICRLIKYFSTDENKDYLNVETLSFLEWPFQETLRKTYDDLDYPKLKDCEPDYNFIDFVYEHFSLLSIFKEGFRDIKLTSDMQRPKTGDEYLTIKQEDYNPLFNLLCEFFFIIISEPLKLDKDSDYKLHIGDSSVNSKYGTIIPTELTYDLAVIFLFKYCNPDLTFFRYLNTDSFLNKFQEVTEKFEINNLNQ